MAKTVPNKPQQLGDTQWLLTWQGSNRTDVITAVIGSEQARVSPFDKSSSASVFMRPDDQTNGLLIDLGRAPATAEVIEFTFDVMAEGDRAWTIEGLSTGEVWQNDSVKVPADAPCLVLSVERADGGWAVVAREKILGEQGDITVDEQIPDAYQELVARATARGLAGNSMNFSALVDITPSMHEAHEDGTVEKLLNCLVAIGASANNRPIDVSFQGVHEQKFSVDDEIDSTYSAAFAEASREVSNAKPLHSLVPAFADSLKPKSTLYVVTESMFFVEEDIIDDLTKVDAKVRVLLTGSEAPRFNLPENDYFKISVIGSLADQDARAVLDNLL
jgi:hypothetical protein